MKWPFLMAILAPYIGTHVCVHIFVPIPGWPAIAYFRPLTSEQIASFSCLFSLYCLLWPSYEVPIRFFTWRPASSFVLMAAS